MKLTHASNDTIQIQANANKAGDYELALAVAHKMVEMGDVNCDIAAVEEGEWVQVCSVWDNYQAADMKDAYKAAKEAINK